MPTIVRHLPAAQALPGCDTVASYFGIGKGTVKRVLEAGHDLSVTGDPSAKMETVISQASSFMSACFGLTQTVLQCPKHGLYGLKRMAKAAHHLQPTTAAFIENAKRAHYQSSVEVTKEQQSPRVKH